MVNWGTGKMGHSHSMELKPWPGVDWAGMHFLGLSLGTQLPEAYEQLRSVKVSPGLQSTEPCLRSPFTPDTPGGPWSEKRSLPSISPSGEQAAGSCSAPGLTQSPHISSSPQGPMSGPAIHPHLLKGQGHPRGLMLSPHRRLSRNDSSA